MAGWDGLPPGWLSDMAGSLSIFRTFFLGRAVRVVVMGVEIEDFIDVATYICADKFWIVS